MGQGEGRVYEASNHRSMGASVNRPNVDDRSNSSHVGGSSARLLNRSCRHALFGGQKSDGKKLLFRGWKGVGTESQCAELAQITEGF